MQSTSVCFFNNLCQRFAIAIYVGQILPNRQLKTKKIITSLDNVA